MVEIVAPIWAIVALSGVAIFVVLWLVAAVAILHAIGSVFRKGW